VTVYLRRLILAFCLSAASYYATEDWYQRTKSSVANTEKQEPIALLIDFSNEVQRKLPHRVIWQSISKYEDLFSDEWIRTSHESEAKILLLKSEAVIELEPNSSMILGKTENGLYLKLIKGHLFVKSSRKKALETGNSLTLISERSKIHLQNADISLSKIKKDGSMNVQVYGGTAQIKQGKKNITIDETQLATIGQKRIDIAKHHIQLLLPRPGEAVYIDPQIKEKVIFQWKKLSSDYDVYIERGKKRFQMTRNANVKAVGAAGKLAIGSRVGRFYWRLVALPKKIGLPVLSSAVIPFPIIAKRPPIPLKPDNQAQIVIKKSNPVIPIKWANPAQLKNLMVKIATDPQLKNPLIQKPLDDKLKFTDIPFPSRKPGTYYWRLTGFMKNKGELIPISSKIRSFQVQIRAKLIPPALRSPVIQQSIRLNQALTKGLFISWDPVAGISSYELNLQRGSTKDRHLASSQNLSHLTFRSILTQKAKHSPIRLNELESGVYRWTVRSISAEGKKSKPAAYRTFVITETPVKVLKLLKPKDDKLKKDQK